LALGFGREKTGRVGTGTGFNAYKLRSSENLYYASGASVKSTGDQSYELATTQSHWSMEGRPVVRETSLEQYRKNPAFAQKMKPEEPTDTEGKPVVSPLYPNPLDKTKANGMHQWGMSIDLNRCVGCSACMIACQSENNIPIVGKEMVGKSREMHWIRLDRYYAGPMEDPQAVAQPMLCQHCESAPCESVCPVNATSHDDEGLNVMTYNRCVGTRYCSNNCPYKVRRFNFLRFQDWETPSLKLQRNPEVTVRSRGVMEKCTYCVQRINNARIESEKKNVPIADGDIVTACEAACPSEAIVFGNANDPNSRVAKLKAQQRNYNILGELNARPRTTYLAAVRNPNPEMEKA